MITLKFNPLLKKPLPPDILKRWNSVEPLQILGNTHYYIFLGELFCTLLDNAEPLVEIIQCDTSTMHSNIEFKIGTKRLYYYYHYEGSVDDNLHSYEIYIDEAYICNSTETIKIEYRLADNDNLLWTITGVSPQIENRIIEIRNLFFY